MSAVLTLPVLQGCGWCFVMGKLTLEEFIRRATLKHGGKYDYSLVHFINSKTKVVIICPIHGKFSQLPTNHLRGNSCKKCNPSGVKTTHPDDYLNKLKEKFGDKYNYSKTVYTGWGERVIITCPIHGDISLRATWALSGWRGCKKCNRHVGRWVDYSRSTQYKNLKTDPYLYVIHCSGEQESFYKIGIASKGVDRRFFPSSMPYKVEAVYESVCDKGVVYLIEQILLELHYSYRHVPKLSFPGETECLSDVNLNIVKELMAICNNGERGTA